MSNFLAKLRDLPEVKKKVIIFTVVGFVGLVLGYFWVTNAANHLSKISAVSLPTIDIPQDKDNTSKVVADSNLPVALPVSFNTDDWNAYVNNEYGFEVKYPKEYISKEYVKKEHYLLATVFGPEAKIEPASKKPYMSVSVYNKISVEDWLKQNGVDTWDKSDNVIVGGQQALHLTNTTNVGVNSMIVVFYKDNIFRLENFDSQNFDAFVSTFTFTN